MSTHTGPRPSGRTGDTFSSTLNPQNTSFEAFALEPFAFDTVIEIIGKNLNIVLVWCPQKWMLRQESACKIFTRNIILASIVSTAEWNRERRKASASWASEWISAVGPGGSIAWGLPLWLHRAHSAMSLKRARKLEYLLTRSCLSLVESFSWGWTACPFGPAPLRRKQGHANTTLLLDRNAVAWVGSISVEGYCPLELQLTSGEEQER